MTIIDGHLLHRTDRVGHLPRLVMKTAIGNTFSFNSKQEVKHVRVKKDSLKRISKKNYQIEERNIRVIRPLVYCREEATRNFATENRLPVIPDNCPACFSAPKERARVKILLSSQEFLYPEIYASFLRAMRPLMERNSNHHSNDDITNNLCPYVQNEVDLDEPVDNLL